MLAFSGDIYIYIYMAPFKRRPSVPLEEQIVEETSLEDDDDDDDDDSDANKDETCDDRKRPSSLFCKVAVRRYKNLWSEDGEIGILNAMIQFRNETSLDPMANIKSFYEYYYYSREEDKCFTEEELLEKVLELKKQYKNTLVKGIMECSSHQIKVFKLCKQVWVDCANTANVKAVTQLWIREMKRFHEDNVLLNEEQIKERLALVGKHEKAEYIKMKKDYEMAQKQLLLKDSQVEATQNKLLLDALRHATGTAQ